MVDQPVYPNSVTIEIFIDAAWDDVSDDVVSPIRGSQGISGTTPTDRVASLGTCEMSLNNITGKYTPDGSSALSGWGRTVPLRVNATFQGVTYNIFWGRVETIDLDSSEWGDQNANIECLDYMNIASQFPLKETALETNKRIEEGVDTLVTALPIAPENTDYGVGITTFPTIFDAIKDTTKAVAEFQKLAISEVGYVYITQDDTIKVEARDERKGTRELDKVTIPGGFLLKEDGDFLLKEDSDKIELDVAQEMTFDNTMTGVDIEYGNGIINQAIVTAFPRKVGSGLEVLFTLEKPVRIRQVKERILKGKYSDPTGGNPIHGTNMQTPVATTDYLLNTEEFGTGDDITGNLTVTAIFYADGVEFTFSTEVSGWLTKSNVRGNSITKYNPLEITREDDASITAYGVNSISIKQAYQDTIEVGEILAESTIEQERSPDVEATKVRFIANNSQTEMLAFLNLKVGGLVHIIEDKNELNSFFYIYNREFVITQGGVIDFAYTIKRTRSLLNGLTAISVEFAGGVSGESLRFPAAYNVDADIKTVIAEINLDAFEGSPGDSTIFELVDNETDIQIFRLFVDNSTDKALGFQDARYDVATGGWRTAIDSLVASTDFTVAVSYDSSSIYNTPVLYIDGVKQTTFTKFYPRGVARDIPTDRSIYIGGIPSRNLPPPVIEKVFDGELKNVRYYNSILNDAEHLRSVTEVVEEGLIFQAPNVVTERLTDYINQALSEDDKVIDNIFGVVGTPLDIPTGRTA